MRLQARCVASLLICFARSISAAGLDDYGRLPQYENVALSPDGKRAAFTTSVGKEREIVVQNFSDPSDVVRFRSMYAMLRRLYWADNEHLMISTSQTRSTDGIEPARERGALYMHNLRTKKSVQPLLTFPSPWYSASGSTMDRIVNGRPVLFLHAYSDDPSKADLRRALIAFDVKAQKSTVVDTSADEVRGSLSWVVDESGRPVVQSEFDEELKRWSLRLMVDGKWVEVQTATMPLDYPTLKGLTPDSASVVVARIEGDRKVMRLLSLHDGKWGDALYDGERDAQTLNDPRDERIIAIVSIADGMRYQFLAKEDQDLWDQVVKSFPGEQVELESWSDDRKTIIVRVFGQKTGAGFVLVDLAKKQTSYLGDVHSGVGKDRIARVVPLRYAAQDGLQIHGYLTVPNGREPKSLPLVVLPHGGPGTRDRLRFDWIAQALASRGYAVLQPNFRGSWGYGTKFQQAGYGEYGRKMQTDLSDGVRYLASRGIVDARRVCIAGISYGGYAALQAASMESDVYRCAVSIAGISDVRKQLDTPNSNRNQGDDYTTRYWKRYYGVDDINDPALERISPINSVDRIRIPIFLAHGARDSVVSIDQSTVMVRALRKANKPHEFVKLNDEDHWLSVSETRIQLLKSAVKFLETHNPP
jgi:dipeptidyl aminopeptidase/acylaminoacyl peptidase